MKSFSYHLPFGTKDAYVKKMMAADLNKLANVVRICGFLMQRAHREQHRGHSLKNTVVRIPGPS
jgi:hypothetical protein